MNRYRSKLRALTVGVRRLMTQLAPAAACLSAALLLWHAARDLPASAEYAPAPLIYDGDEAPGRAAAAAGAVAADGQPHGTGAPPAAIAAQQAGVAVATIEVIVGRNDTLDAIFRRMALDPSDLAAIRNLPGIRQSIDLLKVGESIKVTHADGEVRELTRKLSDTQTLKVVRQDEGFAAQTISNPTEIRTRVAAASIDSSLFQAAESAGVSDGTAVKLANIFQWDIDFVLDIREGDRFTAVYEQIYQNGSYVRDGEILAAEFVNAGKVYRAVRFSSDDGHSGYYTPQGQPMRKALLRAPVEFTRVSSGFNPHRFHPILQRIRGHMGIDYAAPVGTPVHAAGDGRVSFVGWRGGYGNAVMLTHSNSVGTLYGHLSRIAAHLKVGSRVEQGQVIGYVGMTGLATGPHLHYEYLVNGVHRNPQTVPLPAAQPLGPEELRQFAAQTAPLLGKLQPSRTPAGAGVEAPNLSSGLQPAAR